VTFFAVTAVKLVVVPHDDRAWPAQVRHRDVFLGQAASHHDEKLTASVLALFTPVFGHLISIG
jgi:hypothetical protein